MRKTTSTASHLQQRHLPTYQQQNRYGSIPNLYTNNNSTAATLNRDEKSPPYYYHTSATVETPSSSRFPPRNAAANTTVTTTTTLRSNKEPPSLMRANSSVAGESSNGYGARFYEMPPSYNVEHLASFAVGKQFSVLTPSDGVTKLKQMEQNSAICPVPMLFSLFPDRISVSEENGNLVEEFPMALVSDPTAHSSSDPRDMFNNILLFIVLEHSVPDGNGSVPTELHIFQCTNVPAGEVAEDLYNYMRGQYQKVSRRTPTTKTAMVYPNPIHEMSKGHFSHENPPHNAEFEYFEMDVNTLNRCFDDIERFVAKVQSVALAQRELEMQKQKIKQLSKRKKAKEAMKATQNGILHLRAQIPTLDEFSEIFQKFKLCFNLLAKLQNHIHEPSSPELLHFLFTPLTVLLDACHWGLGQQVAQHVYSPLLSLEACELLGTNLFPKEMDVWRALGHGWSTSVEEWLGPLPPPYRPIFSDGWAPYGYPSSSALQQSKSEAPLSQPMDQQRPRYGGSVPALHRGVSAPAQPNQPSNFYNESSRKMAHNAPLPRERSMNNLELERINLEREKLEFERRKVLDKERELMEQEQRLRDETDKLERERRQLYKEGENHSIAGSEPLPDFYRGHGSLQASPMLNRRSGSMQFLPNGQSSAGLSSTTSPRNFSPAFNQKSSRQKAFYSELNNRGSKIVQVTYDRIAQNSKELTVSRGEFLEVLNNSRNWWECRNAFSKIGYVPHTIVTVLEDADELMGPSKKDETRSASSSGLSTPEVIRERRGRNGEFRYF